MNLKADIIVATSINGVIGREGQIPWNCPEDLKHFKRITTDNTVVMGRKTYESIGKALPNRRNFVLTRNSEPLRREKYDGGHRNIDFYESLKEAIKIGNLMGHTYIIGGSQIYDLAFELNLVDKIYLTTINDFREGDAYFHLPVEWKEKKVIESNDNFDIKLFGRE